MAASGFANDTCRVTIGNISKSNIVHGHEDPSSDL